MLQRHRADVESARGILTLGLTSAERWWENAPTRERLQHGQFGIVCSEFLGASLRQSVPVCVCLRVSTFSAEPA
jgi:hypothetical protein